MITQRTEIVGQSELCRWKPTTILVY